MRIFERARERLTLSYLQPRKMCTPELVPPKKAYDLLFKLLLIGDPGVGKTCVLSRYVAGDTFNISNTLSFTSTIGELYICDNL